VSFPLHRRTLYTLVRSAFITAVILTGTPAGASVADLPVATVTIEGDEIDEAAAIEVLGIEIGEVLDRNRLRDAILAMYASTDAEWIDVKAAEAAEGLHLLVTVGVRPKIDSVRVEVGNRLMRKRIEKWLEINPGDTATIAAVEAGENRITRRLRDRGYPDPQVDVFLNYRRSTNTVAVSVAADLGPVITVDAVTVSGVGDPDVAAMAVPKVKTGKKLDRRLEDRIRREVEENLRAAGYWEAETVALTRRGTGGSVVLEVTVDAGDHYRLELEAPPESTDAVRDALPDPRKEELHPNQTDALSERIHQRLQEAGYLLATVSAELALDESGPVLRITADPGAVRRIDSIDFPGAVSLRAKALKSAVSVRPGAVRGLRGQDVSDASLNRDRLALLDLYKRRGFPDAVISAPVIGAVGADAARIDFPVEEGTRWTLTELEITGLPAETAAALDDRPLPLEEASPWDPREVEEGRRHLEGLLGDTGYPDGRASAEIDASRTGEARVVYHTEPGEYVRLGRVVIAGLKTTRESVVQRTLNRIGITEGRPYSRAKMLEAQQQLYELALFRRVELVPMPGQERHTERGLVVLLEEGLHKSYLVGFGWNETDRFRVTLGWYHLNLFGGAHAFSAETQISAREQRFQLGLREPRLPKLDLPAYFVVYQTYEEFPTYAQRRRGLWLDVGDRYKLPFRSWWRYEYQIVEPDNPPPIGDHEEQEARISSITPTLEWDYRDNPLVPTSGTYSEVSLGFAFPLFQADAEFLKLEARTTLYGTIANGRGAVGIRLGAIEPLVSDTGDPANAQVPINTRFFAGGASTHRAFAWDSLGIPGQTINDDGDAVGGNALLLINAEYVRKLSGLFSAHVFVDAGNVWESPDKVRLGDIRWGAGLGISYDTPAGPIRLEYGFKLDREPDESTGEWWLSFGIPF
jgi:outer membrane protein insertion porin family